MPDSETGSIRRRRPQTPAVLVQVLGCAGFVLVSLTLTFLTALHKIDEGQFMRRVTFTCCLFA